MGHYKQLCTDKIDKFLEIYKNIPILNHGEKTPENWNRYIMCKKAESILNLFKCLLKNKKEHRENFLVPFQPAKP